MLPILAFLLTSHAVAQQLEPSARTLPSAVVWPVSQANGVVHAWTAVTSPKSKVYTGTVDVTVTVNVKSTLPRNTVLRCNATAGLVIQVIESGITSPISLPATETPGSAENVDAVTSEGTTTCSFTIPYMWTAAPAALGAGETFKVTGIAATVAVDAVELGSDGAVIRTLRSTSVSAATTAAPEQDNATTPLAATTVL